MHDDKMYGIREYNHDCYHAAGNHMKARVLTLPELVFIMNKYFRALNAKIFKGF